MTIHFHSLDAYPERSDAIGAIQRMIDGLGFRFRWATENLTDRDYTFTPDTGAMRIGELVQHVWGLTNWIAEEIAPALATGKRPEGFTAQREDALQRLAALRHHLGTLEEAAFLQLQMRGHPIWHLINGPLADALTHTGQISLLRRLNGNPVPPHNVFKGEG